MDEARLQISRMADVLAKGGGELSLHTALTREHGERAVECSVRDVVALGPALPHHQRPDVEPLFADGGQHGVEAVDGVAVAQLFVCGAPVGDCSSMAFDDGGGSLAGSLEIVLGSVELSLGRVDVVAP